LYSARKFGHPLSRQHGAGEVEGDHPAYRQLQGNPKHRTEKDSTTRFECAVRLIAEDEFSEHRTGEGADDRPEGWKEHDEQLESFPDRAVRPKWLRGFSRAAKMGGTNKEISMSESVFRELARALDRLANGFPRTEPEIELRLLLRGPSLHQRAGNRELCGSGELLCCDRSGRVSGLRCMQRPVSGSGDRGEGRSVHGEGRSLYRLWALRDRLSPRGSQVTPETGRADPPSAGEFLCMGAATIAESRFEGDLTSLD